MKAKMVTENFFNDPGNDKAISGWTQAFITKDLDNYNIEVFEPFSINVSSDEKNKIQFILNKYNIPFKIKLNKKETLAEGILKFSDGMEFDTSGKLRKELKSDGWYVVGNGLLMPVNSEKEADDFINDFNGI